MENETAALKKYNAKWSGTGEQNAETNRLYCAAATSAVIGCRLQEIVIALLAGKAVSIPAKHNTPEARAFIAHMIAE